LFFFLVNNQQINIKAKNKPYKQTVQTNKIQEEEELPNNVQSKDDSLETLDFIMNVLKEHEKDLDKVISELSTVAEQFGDTGELTDKVGQIEEKLNSLQKEVSSLISTVTRRTTKEPTRQDVAKQQMVEATQTSPTSTIYNGLSVSLRCKHWEDFQTLAFQASTLSFTYKEDEKILQASALKGTQIIKYEGPLPNFSAILKAGLSKKLYVVEENIWEGILENQK
jgi:hypothetical protein